MYFHVWFVTKFRKPNLIGEIDIRIKSLFAECIERHQYKVLEFETNVDHAHFVIEVGNRKEFSSAIRTIKAVSAREINKTLRRNHGGYCRRKPAEDKSFWAKRFGCRELSVSEVPAIREYVRDQKRHNKNTPRFRVGNGD